MKSEKSLGPVCSGPGRSDRFVVTVVSLLLSPFLFVEMSACTPVWSGFNLKFDKWQFGQLLFLHW
jgi:hypothetical protein